MPKVSTRDTLLRQWELLQMLPGSGSGITALELTNELNAQGYSADLRTIQRDLKQLSEAFPTIECNDAGMPYGWRWAQNASSHIPGITVADALSLQLIEKTLRPLLPASILRAVEPRLTQSAARLGKKTNTPGISSWTEKVIHIDPSLPLLAPQIAPDVLETVQTALMADHQLEVMYRSIGNDEPKPMRLHPLGMVQRGPTSYLVATAFNYHKPRIWALHRISSAERIYEKCNKPADFNLKHYVETGAMHFGKSTPIKLEAIISEELARILAETPLSADQVISQDDDEEYTVCASVTDTWQLRWWILSQGIEIEVTSPQSLRKSIASELLDAANQYIE